MLSNGLALMLMGAAVASAHAQPGPRHGPMRAPSAQTGLPSWAQLQAQGARIGQVRVVTMDVFDTTDPSEDKALFHLANRLRIHTRPEVIQRALLFKTGDLLQERLIEETERLLRDYRFLFDVRISALAYRDGVVDIEVQTRDTWSLEPGIGISRAGGSNTQSAIVREHNLLGTGVAVSLGVTKNVDRSGTEFSLINDRLLGSRVALRLNHAKNSDGERDDVTLVRPFYALDTRWSAGISASRSNRIESLYSAGQEVAQYRRQERGAEVALGWSAGLSDGWVRRSWAGLNHSDNVYSPEPGMVAPTTLTANQRLSSVFVQTDWIEDAVDRQVNRNLIGRPEFFSMGWLASARLGWAPGAWGSGQETGLYRFSIGKGWRPAGEQTLLTRAQVHGQWVDGQTQRQHAAAQVQYYLPQGRRWLLYGGVAVDALTRPQPQDMLLLGGDNGLRGYPLRYQRGTRRILATVEERFFTDLYVWRLFRVGGVAFYDVGRAWGGPVLATDNTQTLSNAGIGFRVVSVRSAFSNVLHVDLAKPLNNVPDNQSIQLLVKVKSSF